MYCELDYSFCPKCGDKLNKENKNLLICQKCNYHFYISPKPCNALILENDTGEILFVKRRDNPQKGYWDLPGGFVDINENVEQSAVREAKEELGIDLKDFHYIGSYCDLYNYNGVQFNTIGFVFTGKIGNQKVEAHDDASEAKYFDPNNIPEKDLELLAFPSLLHAIKLYLKLRSK